MRWILLNDIMMRIPAIKWCLLAMRKKPHFSAPDISLKFLSCQLSKYVFRFQIHAEMADFGV